MRFPFKTFLLSLSIAAIGTSMTIANPVQAEMNQDSSTFKSREQMPSRGAIRYRNLQYHKSGASMGYDTNMGYGASMGFGTRAEAETEFESREQMPSRGAVRYRNLQHHDSGASMGYDTNMGYDTRKEGVMPMRTPAVNRMTIVDIAASEANFSTLLAAVRAADLTEALAGDGPFTVFAPTNAAFEALPDGLLETLLLPENKALLTQVLTYHVVGGSMTSDQLMAGPVMTAEGSDLTVAIAGGNVMVNNANVVMADIEASNGVIHVIDSVIIPPSML